MKYITSEARKINVDKSVVKKCIKRVAIASVAAVIGMNLFACTKPETDKITIEFDKDLKTNEQKSKEQESKTQGVTITPEEAARGKTVENTKRTVNEYGNTIYGRKLDKSEPIYNEMSSWVEEPSKYTYTEYYSDAYGGIVYITTTNKSGGIQVFNEKGEKFLAGGKPQNDIEVGLANYRMGNAMAEAIDKTYKK